MPSIRPYRFTGLPKYTRDQIALEASLRAYVGRSRTGLRQGWSELGEKYLKVDVQVGAPEIRRVAAADVAKVLPEVGCFLVVGAAPTTHKILVDFDLSLAALMVERLLGGTGESERILKPLTDIEEGVFSFVALKALAYLHEHLEGGPDVAFTLDRMAGKAHDVASLVGEGDFMLLGVRVSAGKSTGYARAFLPAELITKGFSSVVEQHGGSDSDYAAMRQRLYSLGEHPVTLRCEVATLDLGPDDIAGLELGDIVILEHHAIQKDGDNISGMMTLRVGESKNGYIRAELVPGDVARARIVDIVIQEEPEVGTPMNEEEIDGEGAPSAEVDNLPQTEGLLRDVAAPVVVELGRLRMNTAQVVRLKQGQVLRLPRGTQDPVDLVVHGKVFARGELIEVDGELGVRLVQIVGTGQG